jgi:hypothetical protein
VIPTELKIATRLVLVDQRQTWPDDEAHILIFQCWDAVSITGYTLGNVDLEESSDLSAAYRVLLAYLGTIWDQRRNVDDVRAATRLLADNLI